MKGFRIVQSYDHNFHRELYNEFFPANEDNSALPKEAYTEQSAWFLANGTQGGHTVLAGWAGILRTSVRTAQLVGCGVYEGFREQGLQQELLARRIKFARDNGITELSTHVQAINLHSFRNLCRAGFLPSEVRTCKMLGHSVTFVDMTLTLGRGCK